MQYYPKIYSLLREGYTLEHFKRDAFAGLTVCIVAIPISIAIAIASGVSPEKGIITAIFAGFFAALFGGSRVQVSGPTGGFVVVVSTILQNFGPQGLSLAIILAGLILIVAGYARFGAVIKFVPQPVIIGYTTGIALLLASMQVKDVSTDLSTGGIALLSGASIILTRKYWPKIPSYLIAIVVPLAFVLLFSIPVQTVGSRFPDLSHTIQLPGLPAPTLELLQLLLPYSFTIAFLGGIEGLLTAVIADGMTGYKHRSNQELIGQGIGNITSALFGGLPATGALSRTVANISSGGKTSIAAMFHAIYLSIFLLIGLDLIKLIPIASLATILIFVSWGICEPKKVKRTLKEGGSDRMILLLTFLITVFVSLTAAIAIGVILASLIFMGKMSKSVEFGKGNDEDQRENLPPGTEVFWIAGPLFFGVASDIPSFLNRVGEPPKNLIIRMRHVPFLDSSGIQALESLIAECKQRNILLIFSALQKQPKKALSPHLNKNVIFTPNYDEALQLCTNTSI